MENDKQVKWCLLAQYTSFLSVGETVPKDVGVQKE